MYTVSNGFKNYLCNSYNGKDQSICWHTHLNGSTYKVHTISFQTFFVRAFKIIHRLLKIHYVIAIHLMRWLTNFYDCKMLQKAVWSILYVSVAFFSSLKQNFITYHSSKVSDCNILKFTSCDNLGFSRVYSSSCCSCSFESEILKIGQSSHKMYSNNILNFQESTTISNAHTEKVWNLIEGTTYIYIHIYIYIYIYIYTNHPSEQNETNICYKKRF